jgi:hypothetical protein
MSEQLTRRQVWERAECLCNGGKIPCLKCEDIGNCSRCKAFCYFPHDQTHYLCDACNSQNSPEKTRCLTAKLQIKKYLLDNPKGLTSLDAIRMFNHTRLAARIHELRNEGMSIETVREGGDHWFRLRETK